MIRSLLLLFTLGVFSQVLLASAAPSLYTDAKLVPTLSSGDFRALAAKPGEPAVVSFFTARNGKSKELAPHFTTMARGLSSAFIRAAAVDCKASADVCSEQEVPESGEPLIKLFANGKSFTMKKSVGAKSADISEWLWSTFPNFVQQLTSAGEKKQPRDKSRARVLLFTEKRETSPLYKSLALQLHLAHSESVIAAEIRKAEKGLLNKYGIGKTFPVVLIEPAVKAGEEERSARRYEGKMEKQAILSWIQSFVGGSGSAGAEGGAAGGEDDAAVIPELTDQSCLERYCGGPLCVVMFLSRDHPDLNQHLHQLAGIEKAAHASKSASRANFVWADAVVAPHAAQFLLSNFDLQPQDYPQLVLLSVRKERFAPYVGSFSTEGVLEFLVGVSKGTVRTIPFTTPDKKLLPLPTDTTKCPPEEHPKKSAQPQQPASSEPVKDEGELIKLTPQEHAEAVRQTPRPVLLFFHASDSHKDKHSTLSEDIDRIAKNLRDMVWVASVDVAAHPSLGEEYGITAADTPVIISLPHSVAAKTDPESRVRFSGDLSDKRAIRDWALGLLQDGEVMTVDNQSMQQFMGEMEPGMPFPPKLILFAKPAADGTVAVPDFMRALALEFGGKGRLTLGVASSRDRDFARQFNVTRIPQVFIMGQAEDMPGAEPSRQVRVAASPYDGPITYGHLQQFCDTVVRNHAAVRASWAARGPPPPPPPPKGGKSSSSGERKKAEPSKPAKSTDSKSTKTDSKKSESKKTESKKTESKKSESKKSDSKPQKQPEQKKRYTPPPSVDDEEHVNLDESHDEL